MAQHTSELSLNVFIRVISPLVQISLAKWETSLCSLHITSGVVKQITRSYSYVLNRIHTTDDSLLSFITA